MTTTSRHLTVGGLTPYFHRDYEIRFIRLEPNVTIPAGTIMAEVNGLGIFTPYLPGMQPKCILEFDCQTDFSGRAWYYLALGTDYSPYEKVSAFISGTFRCQDLVGLDQNAAVALGRLIEGNITNGILRVC